MPVKHLKMHEHIPMKPYNILERKDILKTFIHYLEQFIEQQSAHLRIVGFDQQGLSDCC